MAFDFAALAQKGRYFIGTNNVGISPDATIPTTTAQSALVNAANDGGVSLIIDRVYFYLVSGTPAAGATLLLSPTVSKIVAPPTSNSANHAISPSRGLAAPSAAWFQATSTLPATAAWIPLVGNFQLAAANIGQGNLGIELAGKIIIPPGYGLGISVFSAAGTTPKFGFGIGWGEQLLTY